MCASFPGRGGGRCACFLCWQQTEGEIKEMQSLSNEGLVTSQFKKSLLMGWGTCCLMALATIAGGTMQAQGKMELSRGEATVVVEPYAPNIVRVTLSLRKGDAESGPGYGVVAHAAPSGWTQENGKSGDVLKSSRMVVTVSPYRHYTPTGTSASSSSPARARRSAPAATSRR